MTTAKFVQPDFNTQNSTVYKGSIDAGFAVAARIIDQFAPRALDTPAMKVHLDAGYVFTGTTLTEVAAQDTGTITAPVGNPRIDRIVIDRFTGVVSVVTGTPAGSPTAPAIPSGKVPVAQVLLQTSTTAIQNSQITDERALNAVGRGLAGELNIGDGLRNDGSGNLAVSQMATMTIKGNNTGGTANPIDLSVTQTTAMLNAMVGDSGSGGTKGLVPAPGAGDAAANKFLKADGTWAVAGTSVTRRTWTGANDTVVAGDRGTWVVYTDTADRTLAFTAAATLGNGFYVWLQNAGTGAVTLDPNGGELIDGLATYKMYPGEIRMVQCTGTAFNTQVEHPFYLTVAYAASPFTFTKPPGYMSFGVRIGAGGGSGGSHATTSAGYGGGGGACLEGNIPASAVGATETITIGAGGASVSGTADGNVGGTTTFGSLMSVYGGGGGYRGGGGSGGGGGGQLSAGSVGGSGPSSALNGDDLIIAWTTGTLPVGAGGLPFGGILQSSAGANGMASHAGGGSGGENTSAKGGGSVWGGGGGGAAGTTVAVGGAGGDSIYGGAGGGGAAQDSAPGPGAGGTSKFGGAGGGGGYDAVAGTAGTAGTNGYGGGGGGGAEAAASGAGGAGSAAVWGIA